LILPLEETASLLKAGIERVYHRMSDIDRRLRGKGYPNSVSKYNPEAEIAFSEAFVDERMSAELALTPTKERTSGAKMAIATPDNLWDQIEKEYGINKKTLGRRISFVTDVFTRKIIFRDIEQAYILAASEFLKPAVILAGSVIEELLRQYLKYKRINPARDTFEAYIEACKNNDLLKLAIHGLTDSVRHFRNLVHLAKEKSPKHTISKATAKGAVSSIFTVVNDFEK